MIGNEIVTTIVGVSFIFLMTTLGASFVFFMKKDVSPKANAVILGLAAGIMIAASIWSLLLPSIDQSSQLGKLSFLPASIGFVAGGLFLVVIDKIVPHFHAGVGQEEGLKNHLSKSSKMFLAVTIHNVPEGLAVGFAFGAALASKDPAALLSALGLAIGIGIQNVPEGFAVALPLRPEYGKTKAFLFGMGSGAVEPVAAVIGIFLAATLSQIQPYLLSFAAGAMIFVVVEDLIPDAKISEYSHLGTWGVMAGFVIMMILDVALG